MRKSLISVVDDDESIRRTTILLIESFGFRAAAFASAEEFLGSVESRNASCIVVDMRLPGMNGLQLQGELAAAGRGVPIIFISAYDDKNSHRQGMQAGAVAFLGKPFSDEELLKTIRSALRGELGVSKSLISVVDDDESIRRTTTFLIESFGFRAAAFESAESFLNSEQLRDTSCLILDVLMPGMNGLQLQRELASAGHGIPIVFITSHEDSESRGRAMRAGAIAFLSKPFNAEQLLQTVRSALQIDDRGARSAS